MTDAQIPAGTVQSLLGIVSRVQLQAESTWEKHAGVGFHVLLARNILILNGLAIIAGIIISIADIVSGIMGRIRLGRQFLRRCANLGIYLMTLTAPQNTVAAFLARGG